MSLNAQILIVEDKVLQQAVLAYNFTTAGYEAVQASDGHEALQLIDEQPPDLILREWMLLGVSGIRICRQLKVCKNTRAIPIIILLARS